MGEAVLQQSPEQLEQLVAPIALYPDALVAQILAASTYPTEIVEADRWVQQHPELKGEQLAQAVDQQSWDPSVKAVTQFPSVLANMDKNLSWASALGDAYVNQQQAVLDAVQTMRRRAQEAGNLKTTPQENVVTQGQSIVIQPANPEVVYVPVYDPWLVYGPPLVAYPGWFWYPGLYAAGPGISFGIGFGLGFYAGFGWGWHHWDADWRGHRVMYDHDRYVSHSRTFMDRNHFYRGGPGFHGGPEFHGSPEFHGGPDGHGGPGFHAGPDGHGVAAAPAFHGSAAPHPQAGTRSGAFSGFDHGGVARGFSSRGQSSFGGGFHGGGFHGGGGHR
ncbi:MAG: hypothetical protein AUI90_07715 [Deltaproteobacteria bacterium 13_1_40CM_3_69_14]|nr:MAG: hypothetical protein AUI90_07715 [Deltaproteobacteria bacterium 13_1_40CM_3_69_14]